MSEPELWFEPAPRHFDLRVAWWWKLLAFAVVTAGAMLWLDVPAAVWAHGHPIPDLMQRKADGSTYGDAGRELMFLEQYGQFACSVVVILAVALVDPKGRRRALAVAIACLTTLALTHLIKDLAGRSRPFVAGPTGASVWRGPWQTSSAWGSFPSAHTTAAFALASALAWFYPRGRCLFMALATITATQRVLHWAHYVSDVTAGLALGVVTARMTLQGKWAGRLLAAMPAGVRGWWMWDAGANKESGSQEKGRI